MALLEMGRNYHDRYMADRMTVSARRSPSNGGSGRRGRAARHRRLRDAGRDSTSVRDRADWPRAWIAFSLGDLPSCVDLAAKVVQSRSTSVVTDGTAALYLGSAFSPATNPCSPRQARWLTGVCLPERSAGWSTHYLDLLRRHRRPRPVPASRCRQPDPIELWLTAPRNHRGWGPPNWLSP